MTYRPVEARDYDQIKDIYEAERGVIPPPGCFGGIVALDGDRVVGYWGAEVVLHAGPLWVAPEYRNKRVWYALGKHLQKFFKGRVPAILSFSKSDRSSHIFKTLGMTDTGMTVFVKEL